MQNSMMLFTFFRVEILFLGKFGPKNQNYQFISNTCANFNGDVHFFLLPIRNALLCENLVKNVKVVSLRLNLLASLIRICRIQRSCSLFLFSIGNALFWANLVEKAKMISLS